MLRRCGFRLCGGSPQRICYLTDVEGNMQYFQRFVAMSACVRWERAPPADEPGPEAGNSADNVAVELEEDDVVTQYDIQERGVRLTFRDAHTHFVYGGDAFDHGADLSFGTALLDFKKRFPTRVHFILGNRDINKMVMVPAMQEVESAAPEEAERMIFPHHRDADSLRPAEMHYAEFLASEGMPPDTKATRITFLKWALRNKMGSPNAFEHRRKELTLLRRQQQGREDGEEREVSDREVAESFFDAARPGGVYYEFMRQGVLALAVGGVLFVHGGVNEHNIGFVPNKAVLEFSEQGKAGQRFLEQGKDALMWVKALNDFKEESFREWDGLTGKRGEVIRRYVFPRNIVPYSVTVGSFVDLNGPRCVTLPVMEYLLASGLHTVCGGHQPTGDSPAVVQQPGGFVMIDADNSYSGRGNEFCTAANQRGLAVQEIIFRVDGGSGEASGTDGCSPSAPAAEELGWDVGSVVFCGLQADGRPFHFNLDEHPLLGRCVGEDWWVKLPLYRSTTITHTDAAPGESTLVPVQPAEGTGDEAPFYELHRTRDGYRSEEVMTVTAEKLRELLAEHQRSGHVPLPGELRQQYTKEELAEVHVHRIKTKVSATTKEQRAD